MYDFELGPKTQTMPEVKLPVKLTIQTIISRLVVKALKVAGETVVAMGHRRGGYRIFQIAMNLTGCRDFKRKSKNK